MRVAALIAVVWSVCGASFGQELLRIVVTDTSGRTVYRFYDRNGNRVDSNGAPFRYRDNSSALDRKRQAASDLAAFNNARLDKYEKEARVGLANYQEMQQKKRRLLEAERAISGFQGATPEEQDNLRRYYPNLFDQDGNLIQSDVGDFLERSQSERAAIYESERKYKEWFERMEAYKNETSQYRSAATAARSRYRNALDNHIADLQTRLAKSKADAAARKAAMDRARESAADDWDASAFQDQLNDALMRRGNGGH